MGMDMKNTSRFVYQIIVVTGTLMYLLMLSLLMWGELTMPDERTYADYTVEDYCDGWVRIHDDGTREEISLPGHFETEDSHTFVIEKKIESLPTVDIYLSFDSTKQDIEAYVDGQLRYSYSTNSTRLFGSNSPGALMFIPLSSSDIGSTIRIVYSGDNNYSGVIDSIRVGTQLGITKEMFSREKVALIMTIMLMSLGVLALIIGIVVKIAYNKTLSLLFAGWIGMCAGLWSLSESNARQFISPNFSLMSYMTYLCLIMLPFIMAFYFDRLQDGRFRIIYLVMAVLSIFVTGIAILQQFMNDTDLIGVLPYAFAAIIIDMLVFVAATIGDCITGRAKEYWPEAIGVAGALIAGIGQIINYQSKPITVDRTILLAGLLFLIAMSYIRALVDVRNTEINMYAAVKAQDASTAFLTRMSHEMRTPINAILGMNKMILRECGDQTILDYARDVNSAGNYLLGIVNEVLDLAKVNAGEITIVENDYDLMDMIRECYAMVRPRARANRLAFEVDMSDVLPSKLRGDKERLIQVITNLLTNAVKYTPEGRVTLGVDGKIVEGRLHLIVTVRDTGVGIAEENLPYIYTSLDRIEQFDENKITGTGLGLTITRELVDLMEGTIAVESEVGKGTVFTVVIPQEIRSVEPCGTFSMGPNGDRRVADRHEVFDIIGKILVVDDVAINLRVFSMLLNNTDVIVDTAISGLEALEKIKTIKYDIIFIDHLMPGMDGIQLKEVIKTIEDNPNHNTPLIMQTANAVVGAREKYEELGFDDYIEKPIKEEELRKLIRKYIF